MTSYTDEATGVGYSVTGNPQGETITMLHPAFCDRGAFAKQIAALKDDYLVIAMDLPGHGASQSSAVNIGIGDVAGVIERILDRHNCSGTHVLGVSLGGLVAQDFCNRLPAATLSLCVIGGYDINNFDQKVAAKQGAQQLRFVAQALCSIGWFARTNARIATHTPAAYESFVAMNRGFQRRSFRHFRSIAKMMNQYTIGHRAYPLAIVVGEHDLPIAHELSAQWQQREPGSVFREFTGAGHCVNMDVPDAFNDFYREFLASTK